MAFFTEQSLQRYGSTNLSKAVVLENIHRAASDSRDQWVFLSHSHRDIASVDRSVLQYVKTVLADSRVKIYIDAFDPTMPQITSAVTADNLKEHIIACDKFIVVATVNAINSKWVPWELGFADARKTLENIALFPIADASGTWTGSEYLGLYSRIEDANPQTSGSWYPPTTPIPVVRTSTGAVVPFQQWLESGKSTPRQRYG